MGDIPGGLGHVNVFCSVIFAGMSGSALADTGGIGAIELKAMKDAGFDDDFSAAITGASSCLGPIIPPSTGMVLYAMMAEESVGTLFIAGVIPGIIMAAVMCVMVYFTAKKRNYPVSPRATLKERGRALWRAVPALLSPVICSAAFAGHLFGHGSLCRLLRVFALPGHGDLPRDGSQGPV